MHCEPLERSQGIVDNSAFLGSPYFSSLLVTLEARLALLDERGDGFGGVGRAEVDRLGP